jgi:hypothetical protein
VVVKADAGTYGMGVMTVKDAAQVTGLNRKQRNKMSVIKEGMAVSQVIIQEGVHTYERVGSGADGVAEPVVYMIDRFVVGGFYRVHSGRGKDENLNAPGMHFEPLAFETSCSLPDHARTPMPHRTAFTPMAWLPVWRSWRLRSNWNVRHRWRSQRHAHSLHRRSAAIAEGLQGLEYRHDACGSGAGHAVWAIQQPAIHWSPLHGVCAEAVHLEMLADDHDWFVEVDRTSSRLRDFACRA